MTKAMKVMDYVDDFLNTDTFMDYCDSAYWENNFRTENLYDLILQYAEEDGIELLGVEDFDYDSYLYRAYQDTEKGLS